MRLRWIIALMIVGLLIAWRHENLAAAYITIFGCIILCSLRFQK